MLKKPQFSKGNHPPYFEAKLGFTMQTALVPSSKKSNLIPKTVIISIHQQNIPILEDVHSIRNVFKSFLTQS